MEQFEIVDKGNHKMLYCHKRKLVIVVTERFDIPKYPDHFELVFGLIKKRKLAGGPMPHDIVTCFGVADDELDYEPYFRHNLITNAVNYYVSMEWHVPFDEITYSPAYQAKFIDSRSLDPAKMTPALKGYRKRDKLLEPLEFDEWKEQYWDKNVN